MNEYRRLTPLERHQIVAFLKQGQSIRTIAKILGRSASSISRELKRNRLDPLPGQAAAYEAAHAHLKAAARKRKKRPRRSVISGDFESLVREKILLDWSPEQIVGRLKQSSSPLQISHSTIYRYVYKDALYGGELYRHLRTQKKRKAKRRKKQPHSSDFSIPRLSIGSRPKIVMQRSRIGDYERDLVHGAGFDQSEGVVLTIVDRCSRFVRLKHLPKKTARATHRATVKLLRNLPVRTLTNDNGAEFAEHYRTSKSLKTRVYFCNPGAFWERGTNENTNGLLRQYLPRVLDFRHLDPKQVQMAERLLNHRPRKCLGYRTPAEVHRKGRTKVLHC